ncbi:hypothetical protein DZA29_02125 [Citrobacter gillenii]|nr:hypothetical protein DZA29_02125 [Citrobacter gillenii]
MCLGVVMANNQLNIVVGQEVGRLYTEMMKNNQDVPPVTGLHELIHWNGAISRLNREMNVKFGSEGAAVV